MSLNQRVIAEFSTCTPSAPQLRDLSIQTFQAVRQPKLLRPSLLYLIDKRDEEISPSLLEGLYRFSRLERDSTVELDLPAADRSACNNGTLSRSDGVVTRLAEAGMVQHVSGVCAE
jgi:hypothetical protein